MTSARDGLARSVQVRLARHAKAVGADPNLVLTRYAVERFLYRLSRSSHADQFVLKGGLLLLVWLGETIRPTRRWSSPMACRHAFARCASSTLGAS